MSKYNRTITVLEQNNHVMPIDAGGLQQKLTRMSYVYDSLEEQFIREFSLRSNTILGLETVKAGTHVDLHTDTGYGRRSNLLINIGKTAVDIQHSNNDVLETVSIQPDEYFLLDTTKPHGCENLTDTDITFLTINWGRQYAELQHSF